MDSRATSSASWHIAIAFWNQRQEDRSNCQAKLVFCVHPKSWMASTIEIRPPSNLITFVDWGACISPWITGAERTTFSKGLPTNAFWTSLVVPGAMKSGRSLRALSAVILVRYPLLIGTSGIVRESSISAYEFSSLVTYGGLPTFWRRMRDLNPR